MASVKVQSIYMLIAATLTLVNGTLVLEKDFPDPAVILADGRYHAFATNNLAIGVNVQHASSSDLKHWEIHDDSLPSLGSWAKPGRTWAPYVFRNGDKFVMWYTGWHVTSDFECIGVALTSNINEPFVDPYDHPLVCPLDTIGGAIDAYMYEEAGQRYCVVLIGSPDGPQ